MTEEHDARLCAAFPLLYADRFGDMKQTLMCWGFPGDGWFDLIWRLSEKITALAALEPDPARFRAEQVKEKFGALRYYMTAATPAINDAIRAAEAESVTICEDCGKPGVLRSKGWHKTLCDEHEATRIAWTKELDDDQKKT